MAEYIMDWLWVIYMSVVVMMAGYSVVYFIAITIDNLIERRERRERRKNYYRNRRRGLE